MIRSFILSIATTSLLAIHALPCDAQQDVHLAMGLRVGEVTQTSAIVWSRVTAQPKRVWPGERRVGRAGKKTAEYTEKIQVDGLEGATPGTPGQLRLSWTEKNDYSKLQTTPWIRVEEKTDFSHKFTLTGLKPATRYYLIIKARPNGNPSTPATAEIRGSFTTPALANSWQDARFAVITGQAYRDLDDKDGFLIYDAMAKDQLDFLVPTGDTVYYDSEKPRARTLALARHHWHRMYSMPRIVKFHQHVPGYWEKDDHDTYNNDGWPGQQVAWMKPFTFKQGLATFLEQVPIGKNTYRTVRWGQGLQIWMVEGRDFRSPNNMPDGPDKTIWGKEQMAWLKKSVAESDAKFRILISPTPIVGPDRGTKNDNHANEGFTHEGNLVRAWAGALENFYVCCGDRHWQYMSIDPKTKLREFSCGPVSNQHAGGSPGHDPVVQPFHRVKGGYLSVAVSQEKKQPTITFRFHSVQGKVVYEFKDVSRR
ncbi:MAG: alkaline phosphatase D family protein [Planctomycetota bacterium]|nr:alkaline phosphatase D family protein [Planctomycetota bacterium]